MSTQIANPTPTKRQQLLGVAAQNVESLAKLSDSYHGETFSIRFWDESIWTSSASPAVFEIRVANHKVWQSLIHHADEITLARSYLDAELDIVGDIFRALRALPSIQLAVKQIGGAALGGIAGLAETARSGIDRLASWGALHSRTRDAAAISFHYDRPIAFYRLFLGPTVTYSCAYFADWSHSLEQAQNEKMDLICRKLDLRRGEEFLDVGCGWGSLVMHACRNYGVRARGITLSRAQADYAETKIALNGCGGSCRVSERDYRELDAMHVAFDKAASVGMCEHVGAAQIDGYFKAVYDTLRPGGLFLNHGITRTHEGDHHRSTFIDRYVFPDGEILALSRLVRAAEDAGFEVRDVENLREHYIETLHRWVEALDLHSEEATALTDVGTVRLWRLYLAGSAEAFRRGEIAVHQVLLAKKDDAGRSTAFTSRANLYRPGAERVPSPVSGTSRNGGGKL